MDKKTKAIVDKYLNNNKEERVMDNIIAIFVQKAKVNKKWVATGYVVTQFRDDEGVHYLDNNDHLLDVKEIETLSDYIEGFVDADSDMYYAQITVNDVKKAKVTRKTIKEGKVMKQAQDTTKAVEIVREIREAMMEEEAMERTVKMNQVEATVESKEDKKMERAQAQAESFVNGIKDNFEAGIKTIANKSTEFRAFMKRVAGMTDAEAEKYLKDNYDKVMSFMHDKASDVRQGIQDAKLFNPDGDFSDEEEVVNAEQTFAEIIKSKELTIWGKITAIFVKVIKFLVKIIVATAKFLFKVACCLIVGVFKITCVAVNTVFNVGEVVVDEAKPHARKIKENYQNWKAARAVAVDDILDDEDFDFEDEE